MAQIDHGFTTDMTYAVAGTFTGGLSSKGYRLLKNEWYNVKKVYPVCPDKKEIEGDPAYPTLASLPEKVDVVLVVHKKPLTTAVVKEAAGLEPKPAIWFMPGTESTESIALCKENGMKYASSCIMGHREFTGVSRFFNMHNIHAKLAKMKQIPRQPGR